MDNSPLELPVNQVGPFDVVLGRGKTTYVQAGNEFYRKQIKAKSEEYCAQNDVEKDATARAIIAMVEDKGGRFLRPNKDGGKWLLCSRGSVRSKVKQALRDAEKKDRKPAKAAGLELRQLDDTGRGTVFHQSVSAGCGIKPSASVCPELPMENSSIFNNSCAPENRVQIQSNLSGGRLSQFGGNYGADSLQSSAPLESFGYSNSTTGAIMFPMQLPSFNLSEHTQTWSIAGNSSPNQQPVIPNHGSLNSYLSSREEDFAESQSMKGHLFSSSVDDRKQNPQQVPEPLMTPFTRTAGDQDVVDLFRGLRNHKGDSQRNG